MENETHREKSVDMGKITFLVLSLYLTTSISVIALLYSRVHDLHLEIAGFKANRLTIQDANRLSERMYVLEKEIVIRIKDIEKQIAREHP